jgi:hypothetical protein
MPTLLWISAAIAALFAFGTGLLLAARRWEERQTRSALQSFRLRRELLEAKFLDLARSLGKPRGLHWRECEWLNETTFARDRSTGLITAFVGVNIHFEAIAGGDMEHVAAVGTVRDAVALFHFQHGVWGTGGKALFNMNPEDAVTRLVAQYERLPA